MEQWIWSIFAEFAYSPWLMYGTIVLFMLMSAFGLPIPEEVVLISAGIVGYMSLHPEEFPPPAPGAAHVDVYVLAAVAFFAVISADYLVFYLGHRFGPKVLRWKFVTRFMRPGVLDSVQKWTKRHGVWAAFAFRFLPGIRFPGHLMCGAMGMSHTKFLAVDFFAAGISVPTQVLLVSFYGEFILQYLKQFKIYVFFALITGLVIFFTRRWLSRKKTLPTKTALRPDP